jgi:hypothetical protein
VDQYFNDSTGVRNEGDVDARGPWNEGGEWEYVEAPAFQEFKSEKRGTRTADSIASLAGVLSDGESKEHREGVKAGGARHQDQKHLKAKREN